MILKHPYRALFLGSAVLIALVFWRQNDLVGNRRPWTPSGTNPKVRAALVDQASSQRDSRRGRWRCLSPDRVGNHSPDPSFQPTAARRPIPGRHGVS